MKVDINVIINEYNMIKNANSEIDIMSDAYKTNKIKRDHNQSMKNLASYLKNIIDNYDKLSVEEWDTINNCFYYGYKVRNKKTKEESIIYAKCNDKLHVLNGIKIPGGYKNRFTPQEMRDLFEYVRDENDKPVMDCHVSEYLVNFAITSQLITKLINKNK